MQLNVASALPLLLVVDIRTVSVLRDEPQTQNADADADAAIVRCRGAL